MLRTNTKEVAGERERERESAEEIEEQKKDPTKIVRCPNE